MNVLLSGVVRSPAADLDLLVAWRMGDRDAGLALVERYHDALYRFFDAKVAGDVQGLVTQTFRACAEVGLELDGVARFEVLLWAAARAALYGYLEAQYAQGGAALTVPIDPSSMSLEELGGSPMTHGSEGEGLLERALPMIPLESQLLLELRLREGLSLLELAYVMGQPAAWVVERAEVASRRWLDALEELGADEDLEARLKAALARWSMPSVDAMPS
ncbi:MAG: hypothetical protein KDK70_13110 [Myxococcales bacterium]|nr:hypothetical protein [Myxococcales bacterium]